MNTILFFDLDATLIENHFSRKVFQPLLQEISQVAGIGTRELWQSIDKENQRRQKEDPDNVLTMDWDDMMRELAQKHSVTLSDAVDNLWRKHAHIDDIQVLDNSVQVLEKLRHEKRRLVLATKGLYKYQEPILEITGLAELFDDILTPDRTGYLKTSPQYFDKYRQEAALFIHIGDHYFDDVICPKRNGFYSVMRAALGELAHYDAFERPRYLADFQHEIPTYPKEGTDVRPDAVVVSLQELPAVIEAIEKQKA